MKRGSRRAAIIFPLFTENFTAIRLTFPNELAPLPIQHPPLNILLKTAQPLLKSYANPRFLLVVWLWLCKHTAMMNGGKTNALRDGLLATGGAEGYAGGTGMSREGMTVCAPAFVAEWPAARRRAAGCLPHSARGRLTGDALVFRLASFRNHATWFEFISPSFNVSEHVKWIILDYVKFYN